MNHPDQKTIELLALDSPELIPHREELERHFDVCQGCRSQYEEMRQFYRALRVVEPIEGADQEATRPRLLAQPGFVVSGSPKTLEPKKGVTALWRSVRSHPRISVGVLAAAIAMTSFLLCNKYKPIPTFANLNIYRQRLEVFDQRREFMWEVPARADSSFMSEEAAGHFMYLLSDLSGDGIPELVTTLQFLGDNLGGRRALRVLDNFGKVRWTKEPQAVQVAYGGAFYDEWYGHGYLSVARNAAKRSIIISSWNGTRSPAAEVVYDPEGKKLGEYWHFGQLQPTDTCDIDGDGISEVVAIGTNQSANDNMGFAVAVFLKPDAIRGRSQSVLTPGFGMPPSNAEVAYVRFPFSDMNRVLHWGTGTVQLERSGGLLNFKVSSGVNDGVSKGSFCFNYLLARNLRPIATKWDENARAYHAELLSRGLIHSRFDTSYTRNLTQSVRFWNGSAWQAAPTLIRY